MPSADRDDHASIGYPTGLSALPFSFSVLSLFFFSSPVMVLHSIFPATELLSLSYPTGHLAWPLFTESSLAPLSVSLSEDLLLELSDRVSTSGVQKAYCPKSQRLQCPHS